MLNNFLVLLKEFVKKVEKDGKLRLKALSHAKLDAVHQQINILKSETARFAKVQDQYSKQADELSLSSENVNRREEFAKVVQSISVTKNRPGYEKNCVTLNNASFWDECLARIALKRHQKASSELNEQRNIWKQQGRYAVFSTPDLIAAYWSNIGNIEKWLRHAKSELDSQRKTLSSKQAYQYKIQLQELEDELQNEKIVMRASLLTRISIAHQEGDLRFDDLVFSTVKTLQKIKAIPVFELSTGVRRHITPSILRYVQQIIGIDGTVDEKNQLNQLLYGSPMSQTNNDRTASLNLRTNHLGVSFAIPGSAKDMVSDQPPFYTKLPKMFHFLFRGEKTIYEFFQHSNCQYLLIAQNWLPRKEIDVNVNANVLTYSADWDYCQDLTKLLLSEQKRRKKEANSLSSVIYPTAHRLLGKYQARLFKIAHQLLSKQLKLFDRFLSNLEQQLKTRALLEEELKFIKDVEIKISLFQKNWGIKSSIQWQNLVSRYQDMMKQNSQSRITDVVAVKATQAMKKIKVGKKLNTQEQALVVEVSKQVSSGLKSDTYEKTTCVMNHRVMVNNLEELLMSELSKIGLTMTSGLLVEHLQALKQHFESISTLNPTLVNSSETQIALYRYFYTLLKNIESLSGRSDFTTLEGHLQFILKTLLQLPLDNVLRKEVSLLSDAIEKYKSFDWDLFKLVAIKPSLNAFYKVLEMNNALDNKTSLEDRKEANLQDHAEDHQSDEESKKYKK